MERHGTCIKRWTDYKSHQCKAIFLQEYFLIGLDGVVKKRFITLCTAGIIGL